MREFYAKARGDKFGVGNYRVSGGKQVVDGH